MDAILPAPRPAPWAAEFVGIPFRPHGRDETGVDCWGLVCLVYRRRFGLLLPDHTDAYDDPCGVEAVAAAIAARREGWRRLSGPFFHDGDVVLLRVSGRAAHVGVIAAPPWFLHAQEGTGVVCDRLDGWRWRTAADSVWRHPDFCGGAAP